MKTVHRGVTLRYGEWTLNWSRSKTRAICPTVGPLVGDQRIGSFRAHHPKLPKTFFRLLRWIWKKVTI